MKKRRYGPRLRGGSRPTTASPQSRCSRSSSSLISSLVHSHVNLEWCDDIKLSNLLLPRKSCTIKSLQLLSTYRYRVSGFRCRPFIPAGFQRNPAGLPSDFGTLKTVKARFWPWLEPFPRSKALKSLELFPPRSAAEKVCVHLLLYYSQA